MTKEQWAFFIGSYLTGEALTALKALEKEAATDYQKLKQAILDRYEITHESNRQCLWASTFREGACPRVILVRLKDVATRWLKPTTSDNRRIVKLVVIEQLLTVLPSQNRYWLACWCPKSLTEVLELWENFGGQGAGVSYLGRRWTWQGQWAHSVPLPHPGPPHERTRLLGGRATELPRIRSFPSLAGHPQPTHRGRPPRGMASSRNLGEPGVEGAGPVPCFRCSQWGHWKRECPLMEFDWVGDPSG